MFPPMVEMMTQLTSTMAGLMVAYHMFQNYFPYQLRGPIRRYSRKLVNFFYPYIQITFNEYHCDGFARSNAYVAIERYLNANSSKQAKRLLANVVRDSEAIVLTMAKHEEVTEFDGIKLWWTSSETVSNKQTILFYPERTKRGTLDSVSVLAYSRAQFLLIVSEPSKILCSYLSV